MMRAVLIGSLLILAACGTTGAVQGGGTESGSHARVQVGVPF